MMNCPAAKIIYQSFHSSHSLSKTRYSCCHFNAMYGINASFQSRYSWTPLQDAGESRGQRDRCGRAFLFLRVVGSWVTDPSKDTVKLHRQEGLGISSRQNRPRTRKRNRDGRTRSRETWRKGVDHGPSVSERPSLAESLNRRLTRSWSQSTA